MALFRVLKEFQTRSHGFVAGAEIDEATLAADGGLPPGSYAELGLIEPLPNGEAPAHEPAAADHA